MIQKRLVLLSVTAALTAAAVTGYIRRAHRSDLPLLSDAERMRIYDNAIAYYNSLTAEQKERLVTMSQNQPRNIVRSPRFNPIRSLNSKFIAQYSAAHDQAFTTWLEHSMRERTNGR